MSLNSFIISFPFVVKFSLLTFCQYKVCFYNGTPNGQSLCQNIFHVVSAQQELAEAVGVSRQTINSIEAGRYVPSAVLALKIAGYFGKPVESVFLLEDDD